MHPSKARFVGVTLALTGIGLAGCSGTAGEDTAESSQALGITVELPQALGGGTRVTQLAVTQEPTKPYPLGLEGPIPNHDPEGTEGPSAADVVVASDSNDIDLSRWAPPAGDQGSNNDCSSWASGYSSLGWWTKKEGRSGNPFNPVFLYSQLSDDHCTVGTTLEAPLDLLKSAGNAPLANYGDVSCKGPSTAQKNDAAAHRISGYISGWPLGDYHECGPIRFPSICADTNQQVIEANLGQGPIIIGVQIYSEFENADSDHTLIGLPRKGSKYEGNHAITIMKIDSKGAWIENQWGTWWGNNGWAELTWDYINSSHVFDAAQITGLR